MTAPPRLASALADRYTIERELGAGGMATVYLALDLKHRRKVAIKVLRPELSAVLGSERFLQEIELTASLQHPNILPLFDSGSVHPGHPERSEGSAGLLYYVMPFVEGETLRAKLTREHQLPIPEAIRITSAVGAALDYAHRHGAVHRDIKPENILLSEDSVLVADFGIALAVRDAGGSRLTETGLSLGTPQYMSPEQATGDRHVDARSDIYSLGSVLYEMLAGEPPFSGPNTQAVIAKLITERPVRLRTLRGTVSAGLDAAVERALAKAPADRFATCREFIEALAAAPTITAATVPVTVATARARTLTRVGLVGLAALLLLGGWLRLRQSPGAAARGAGASLQGRTQITTTGKARLPAISADGKQLAFVSTQCTDDGCSDVVNVQDVGGSVIRRILEGSSSVIAISWSSDRRHLIVQAGIGGRGGYWLVSALGGPPRYVASHNEKVAFMNGGDSLTILRAIAPDSSFWLCIAGLDGTPRDSIRLPDSASRAWSIRAVPGTRLFAAELRMRPARWVVALIDRDGRMHDQTDEPEGNLRVSGTALWWGLENGMILHQSFEPNSGRLAMRRDTLLLGKPGGDARGAGTFDMTADGTILVVDDGIYAHDVWGVEWPDLAQGRLPDKRWVLQTSSDVWSVLSPDGANIALLQPDVAATGKMSLSFRPFSGGTEAPLLSGLTPGPTSGTVFGGAVWADSVNVAVATQDNGHARLERVNIRTGARTDALVLPDSLVDSFDWLPAGGWAWIPGDHPRIAWLPPGTVEPRYIALPQWYDHIHAVRQLPTEAALSSTVRTVPSIRCALVPSPCQIPHLLRGPPWWGRGRGLTG